LKKSETQKKVMELEVRDPGGMLSLAEGKKKPSSAGHPSSEAEHLTKKMKKIGDRRAKISVRRDDDETVVAQTAQVLVIFALVSLNSGNKCTDFVSRDFNAAINISRCAVLETRPEELTQANFVEQPLRLEVYLAKLKTIAAGR